MTQTLEEPQVATKHRALTKSDRCDQDARGSEQAFVIAFKEVDGVTKELLFCGHHYRLQQPALVSGGWDVVDYTDSINEKPTETVSD
jgi:hypothetical protein